MKPVVVLLLLSACASHEVLESRSGEVPPGIDFSGNWVIQSGSRENDRRIREAIRKTDGIKDGQVLRPSGRSKRGASGGLVFVFLETGRSLKITQTRDGMFISFDRSVVDEFRFGENRLVSIGQVEAQRVTGWEGQQLVVETLDRNNMKLTDRFELTENGQVLRRTITFRSSEGQTESITQLFDLDK